MSVTGFVQAKGDFGNPSGTGIAKIQVSGLPDEAHATLETRLSAFHSALVTAQLTATNAGECSVTYGNDSSASKPGADVNVDRKIIVTWNRASDATIHRLTVSGVPSTSTSISPQDAGERINDAGRTALAAAINTVYALTPADAIVLTGKVIQKA